MKKGIWTFKDYKEFIDHALEMNPSLSKSGLAKATTCQSAYISQVLRGTAHFSLEQAMKAAQYLELTTDEQDYFLTVLQYNRAGTTELKNYFKSKMDEISKSHLTLSKRLKTKHTLSIAEQSYYYTSWINAAVHLMVIMPQVKDLSDLARLLNVPLEKVKKSLEFLLKTGLVEKTKTGYKSGNSYIHLSPDSPLLPHMHMNTRQLVMEKLQRFEAQDLKDNLIYSSTITLSQKDFDKIKEVLIGTIQEIKSVIRTSEEEVLGVFNVDFISIT